MIGDDQVHERLTRYTARVLVVPSGDGRHALALAATYPAARVDGLDSDDGAIAAARREAARAGLDDRVRFELRDPLQAISLASYDVVIFVDDHHGNGETLVAVTGPPPPVSRSRRAEPALLRAAEGPVPAVDRERPRGSTTRR